MSSKYTTFNLNINTLSPLHIGSGEYLSSTGEYLTTTDNVFFLDNDMLIEEIDREGYLQDFTAKILDSGVAFHFEKVLKEWGIEYNKHIRRQLKLNKTSLKIDANNTLYQFVKTNNQAYIPGSSFKGMLRTAVLYKILIDNPKMVQRIEKELEDILDEGKGLKAINNFWVDEEKKILPEKVFNALRSYDSDTLSDDDLVIEQVNRTHFFGKDADGLDWLAECIKPDTKIPLDLIINFNFDNSGFSYLKDDKIEDIFELINLYSTKNIEFEIKLLKKVESNKSIRDILIKQLDGYKDQIDISEKKYAIARLGKGKTLFFQTILMLLKDDLRDKILALIKKEEGVFAKSRVLALAGTQMLGWIKVECDDTIVEVFKSEEKDTQATNDSRIYGNSRGHYKHKNENITNNKQKEQLKPKETEEKQIEKAKKIIVENTVSKIEVNKTKLKVVYLGKKRVKFELNGGKYSDIQVILHYKKQVIPIGEIIEVLVWGRSKEGKINQVKLV